jgi:hypothetical protein
MAKSSSKSSIKSETKTTSPGTKSKPLSSNGVGNDSITTDTLDKAAEEALKTLKSLEIDPQLQEELEWCLGSYRFDKNPSGLYEVAGRALTVLNAEKAKKTKGVTVKLIGELEKALKIQ